VSRGQSAGHVFQKARETNSFQISINLAPHESVRFNLTYQEILKRVQGVYRHVLNIQPDQRIRSVNISVNIHELGRIKRIHVKTFFFDIKWIIYQVSNNIFSLGARV